jgi:hypothetical protein
VTRSTSRRRTVLASLATLSLLTACSSPVGGNPSAASSPPASSSSSTSSSAGSDPFANLSPCTLLDQALKDEGYPAAAPNSGDPRHACEVSKPVYGGVGLQLQAGRNYEDIGDPSKGRTGDVNGRSAVQVKERLGSKGDCEIFLDVRPNSRAIVLVTLVNRNTDEACTYAGQEATKIEPLLPK